MPPKGPTPSIRSLVIDIFFENLNLIYSSFSSKKTEKLKTEKIKIENDLSYIEKIAREKYKMVKPGEKIFKVVDN